MKISGYTFIILIVATLGFLSYSVFQNGLIGSENWFPSHIAALGFTILILLWVFAEVINGIKSKISSSGNGKDKGSFWLIIISVFLSVFISINFKAYNIGTYTNNIQYIGLTIGFIGILFREWAIIVLGKSYTVNIETDRKRKLTKDGPYRYIRHPAYTGAILTLIGLPLATGTWLGTIIVFIFISIAMSYRIKIEEKALTQTFGKEYENYRKKTWKLFPGY